MIRFSVRTLRLKRASSRGPEAIAAAQHQRLVRAVRHAMRHSPFYRERYRGIAPDRPGFSVRELPPVTKAELMADFDRTVTDPAITREALEAFLDDEANLSRKFLGRYLVAHTSGSQGQPMLLVMDAPSVDLFFGLQMTRGNAEPATPYQALRRLIHPKRLAVVTLLRGFYPSAALFEHMPAVARRYINLLWLSQTDPDLNEKLHAFRPEALTGYAGVLEMLSLEAEAGRLRLSPGLIQVVNNSEEMTDRARERIERAFGIHAMNNYATGECPFLSNGCPTDTGAHVNADHAILEVVDEEGRPVPDGTPGAKVYITNLANLTQPILRYEVGDVVTMATSACRCGSRLPRVERIAGRAADVFWVGQETRSRRMISLVFGHAFEFLREVREWQAEQVGPCEVRVRLEPVPGATIDLRRARRAIDHELNTYGYQDVAVSFEIVPRLAADPATGKFRRMVSRWRVDSPRAAGAAPAPAPHFPVRPQTKNAVV